MAEGKWLYCATWLGNPTRYAVRCQDEQAVRVEDHRGLSSTRTVWKWEIGPGRDYSWSLLEAFETQCAWFERAVADAQEILARATVKLDATREELRAELAKKEQNNG